MTIEVPTGSGLHGAAGAADFACDGELGDVRIRTGVGNVRLVRMDSLSVKSGAGDITVDHARRNSRSPRRRATSACASSTQAPS